MESSFLQHWRDIWEELRVMEKKAIAFGKKSSNKVYGVDAIRERLVNFETMTWREILLDTKKQNHNVSVDKLIKEAHLRFADF